MPPIAAFKQPALVRLMLGVRQAVRLTLVVMFALAVLGSVEKLGSTSNFTWFTVMPFLYVSIGGLRLGGLLTVSHFVIIAGCYLTFAQPVIAAEEAGTWVQVGLAYFTAAGLAISYEHMQRELRHRLCALADHDPLTGLLNDEYGHDVGDSVLREISMGAAEWRPDTDLDTALKQADVALYQAKAKGRNRLVAATDGSTRNLQLTG